MLGTYASAALICAASLLVGRALLALAGRTAWSWMAPAAGLGAMLSVAGVLSRAPGHGTSATLGLAVLIGAAAIVLALRSKDSPARGPADTSTAAGEERPRWQALRRGLPVAIAVALALSIPFAMTARWGLLGMGLNNDLGLHLAWAEWLRGGLGPVPEAGYPLGPHGVAVAAASLPGIGLGQAFIGEIFAIGILTALAALGALPGLGRARIVLAATMVAVPYLAVSYFAQGAFKEMAEALFVLAFAVSLRDPGRLPAGAWARAGFLLPHLALLGGAFFAYSFAGLAWPLAIFALWALTRPSVRRALAPRGVLRFLRRPPVLGGVVALVAAGTAVTLVGPFGFISSFGTVAGSDTYGPVSPAEALGVWPTSNYRLDAPGGVELGVLWGALGALAVLAGAFWWLRRGELTIPVAFGATVVLYVVSLPFSGEYSQAKALMIAAPLAMLVAIRPLLAELGLATARRAAWSALAVAFLGGAAYSSFLVLRNAPVSPPGHGAELRSFLPIVHGKPVLYAGQDRYAAYELLGADTHVPLVEFDDHEIEENPEKPFDKGDAYSPIDFDSFSRETLDRFPYVVTGRAAWNSEAPPSFRRVDATPSYVLWERVGEAPENRHVLLEGTEAAAPVNCAEPETRILLSNPGRAAVLDGAALGPRHRWDRGALLGTGERTSQELRLPPGRWRLSLQYFAPFELTLSAPGFSHRLKPALDGQRPNTISLANDGQYWPAGTYESEGGAVRFTVAAAEPTTLQRLAGYNDTAYLGSLAAVPAQPRRLVPLGEACGSWIDWYRSPASP